MTVLTIMIYQIFKTIVQCHPKLANGLTIIYIHIVATFAIAYNPLRTPCFKDHHSLLIVRH